jgi:FAD binding domain
MGRIVVTVDAEAMLRGRVTYERFAAASPSQQGQFADKLNTMPIAHDVKGDGFHYTLHPQHDRHDRGDRLMRRPPCPLLICTGAPHDGRTGDRVELAVRSGGHSLAGHSTTEGGIVLDLSAMTTLELDPVGRTAWAQTGLTAGEYTTKAHAYGPATATRTSRRARLTPMTKRPTRSRVAASPFIGAGQNRCERRRR